MALFAAFFLSLVFCGTSITVTSDLPCINSLTLKSDLHLISPYNISPDSNIKVMRIKEMITYKRGF